LGFGWPVPALVALAAGAGAFVALRGDDVGVAVVGALVLTVGAGWAFAVDAATFAISAVALAA
jgi:hypothetical protein